MPVIEIAADKRWHRMADIFPIESLYFGRARALRDVGRMLQATGNPRAAAALYGEARRLFGNGQTIALKTIALARADLINGTATVGAARGWLDWASAERG